jgi:cell wall-associated NlpC family hydrolase
MAMMRYIPPYSREEIALRALKRVGGRGSLPDEFGNSDPNCLEFLFEIYGYPMLDLSHRIGEIGSLWDQVKYGCGWTEKSLGEKLRTADIVGFEFRGLGHLGIYVGSGVFVHVMGRIRKSRIKHWKRHITGILDFPDGTGVNR